MGDTANEIKAELARRIKAEIARRNASNSLADFVLYTKPDYQMGWFHREICEALDRFLQDVIDKKSPRLIITQVFTRCNRQEKPPLNHYSPATPWQERTNKPPLSCICFRQVSRLRNYCLFI